MGLGNTVFQASKENVNGDAQLQCPGELSQHVQTSKELFPAVRQVSVRIPAIPHYSVSSWLIVITAIGYSITAMGTGCSITAIDIGCRIAAMGTGCNI